MDFIAKNLFLLIVTFFLSVEFHSTNASSSSEEDTSDDEISTINSHVAAMSIARETDNILYRPINENMSLKNIYFGDAAQLSIKGFDLPKETDKNYFFDLIEQLTENRKTVNPLFIKVFCIYSDSKEKHHYVDSPVVAQFHHAISIDENPSDAKFGITVLNRPLRKKEKEEKLIDFSSRTRKTKLRKLKTLDGNEEDVFIYTNSQQPSGIASFLKADENSEIIVSDTYASALRPSLRKLKGQKYANSIFTDLLIKNNLREKIKSIEAFGIKFFSKEDSSDENQSYIAANASTECELSSLRSGFEDSIEDVLDLNKVGINPANIPLISIYYSIKPNPKVKSYCVQKNNPLPLIYNATFKLVHGCFTTQFPPYDFFEVHQSKDHIDMLSSSNGIIFSHIVSLQTLVRSPKFNKH